MEIVIQSELKSKDEATEDRDSKDLEKRSHVKINKNELCKLTTSRDLWFITDLLE